MNAEMTQYLASLRTELGKDARRPPKGELLRQAFEIPLIWPEHEFPPTRSLAEQMAAALRPWAGRVHPVQNESEVVAKAAGIIEEAGAKRVGRWLTPRLDRFDWEEGLAKLGLDWMICTKSDLAWVDDEEKRQKLIGELETLEVGITDCDFAIAHTGTMVFRHTDLRHAYMSLFPWTHIAVVWESQVVRTVQDAIDRLAQERGETELPSNTTFITGPSRSGDIDLAHGRGAAGPGELHIIYVEGEESDANSESGSILEGLGTE